MYHNEGDGRFKEMGFDAGVAVSEDGVEQANMGLALGDYMHTGRISVAVTHFSDEYATLYRNDAAMSFSDVSHAAGIARATVPFVGWGDAFVDLDNSGWLDLILVNGHVYPQVDDAKTGTAYKEPKLLFQNQQNGTFRDVSAEAGAALRVPQVSRGLAVGDLFNRGRLDIVVENLTGAPMILEARSQPTNHWVSFDLEGSPANRLALNARVFVTTKKFQQMGEVRSGGSYLSQNDLRLHFGLGDAARIDKVEVRWPNGGSQVFEDVAADRFLSFETRRDARSWKRDAAHGRVNRALRIAVSSWRSVLMGFVWLVLSTREQLIPARLARGPVSSHHPAFLEGAGRRCCPSF